MLDLISRQALLLPVRSFGTRARARTHGGAWVTEWRGLGDQQLKATVALVTCCLLFGWLPSATTVCPAIRCVPTSHDTS